MLSSKQIDIAVGYCSHPDCRIRQNASEGILPNEPLEFVYLRHTLSSRSGQSCENPQMHLQCFRKHEELIIKCLKSNTLKPEEKRKAIWDESRQGKYDMIQSLCVCKCGGRFIPKIIGSRSDVATSCTTPIYDKKKKVRQPKQVSPHRFMVPFGDDEIDEDAKEYLYCRETDDDDLKESESQVLPDISANDMFPELPFSGRLPSPKKANIKTQQIMPKMEVKDNCDFTCLIVHHNNNTDWVGWIIGPQGSRLKKFDQKNGTFSRIHKSALETVRIIICNKANDAKNRERRLMMTEHLQTEIVKYFTR